MDQGEYCPGPVSIKKTKYNNSMTYLLVYTNGNDMENKKTFIFSIIFRIATNLLLYSLLQPY